MLIAVELFTGLEIGFRHVDGEILDDVYGVEDRFSWGLLLSFMFFTMTIGFDKRQQDG